MIHLGRMGVRYGTAKGELQETGVDLQLPRLRLLVVDDDPLNRDMMALMLAPLGCELEFACDGSEALEAITTRVYDLVFLDLILPDLNGLDVCRRVREWEAGKGHLPIVAVTAYDMPGTPAELAKAGMDDYIFKPYDLRSLSRIIELYVTANRADPSEESADGAAAPGAEVPILDSAGSLIDFSNDLDGYKELLRGFLRSLPERLHKLERAHESGDLEALNRECHTLKGVSAGLGAVRLSRLATQLGRACNDGRVAAAPPLIDRIRHAITELEAEGRVFLKS